MHVAVARMHVQRDEHAAFQHALVQGVALVEYRLVSAAVEYLAQRFAHFAFPGSAQLVALYRVEHTPGVLRVSRRKRAVRQRRVQVIPQPLPAAAHIGQYLPGFVYAISEQFGIAELFVVLVVQRQLAGEELIQCAQQL